MFQEGLEYDLLHSGTLTIFSMNSQRKEAPTPWHRHSTTGELSSQQRVPSNKRISRTS